MLTYKYIIRTVYFFLIGVPVISGLAQTKTDENWFFGNGTWGIQFSQPNKVARQIRRPAVIYGNAGGAVASDPVSGGLLFYTDGNNIYDATHKPMPGGVLQGSASFNQPAVITQVPGQTSRYFVITNDAGQIRQSEVDMTAGGNAIFPSPPLGDVLPTNTAITNLNNESQGMIVIPNKNGTDFWLITQRSGSDQFTVTPITSSGISAPATTTGGGALISFSASHIAYHAGTGKLAVTPSGQNQNVMIYSFFNDTGVLQFDRFVFNSAVTAPVTQAAFYDVEFSNDGKFLYVSRQGDTGVAPDLIQFRNLPATLQNTLPASVLPQPVTIARSYGLQLAPDSSIYHLYQATAGGPFLVGKISDPDTTAANVNYVPLPLGNNNFNAKQFPSFALTSKPALTLSFEVSGDCANTPTTFFPTVVPGADSLKWEFGDNSTSTEWSPSHTYQQGQAYNVILKGYLNGDSTIYGPISVNIKQFNLQLTLVQDTTACSCELKYPDAPDATPTDRSDDVYSDKSPCKYFQLTAQASGSPSGIQWYGPSGALAGQNSLTLTSVDSAGFYYVIAQDASAPGCFAYAGVNIKEYGVNDPRSNIWHFGKGAGLNFNGDFKEQTGVDPVPGYVTSEQGVAVICDSNGQIILSTNGEDVFDVDGNPLVPNPPGFGGSQHATQSSLIIPVPSDPTLYYIFTTQEIYPQTPTSQYELRYAIFDQKSKKIIDSNGAAPGVSSVLFTKSTERLTGNQNWVIAHEYGNNNFRAYRVTGQGLSSPVVSSIGSVHSTSIPENGQGYMKLGGNNMLAVALSSPGVSNVVELFDFDNATGVVSNFRQINLNQTTGQVYGLEFSGTKLFASTKFSTTAPGPSTLHEFVYDTLTNTYIKTPALTPKTSTQELGAIQQGPDGTTYVAVNGSGSLGTLTVNPDKNTASSFNPSGQPLSPTVPPGPSPTSTLGLPNFIQNIGQAAQSPTIAVTGNCLGSPTTFTGAGTDPIDTLTWIFDDGTTQKGVNLNQVQHTYTTARTYNVRLVISNRCVGNVGNLSQQVVINPVPPNPTFTVDPNIPARICTGSETLQALRVTDFPASEIASYTYQWSNGATTNQISVTQPGNYSVTITTPAGCTSQGTLLVPNAADNIDLGPDQSVCTDPNGTLQRLDTQLNSPNHQWSINGTPVVGNNTRFQSVTTTLTGTFVYKVVFTNPITNCVAQDQITYTFNQTPTFTATGNTIACGATTGGQITITASAPAASQFNYTVSGGAPHSGLLTTGVATNTTPADLGTGSFGVTVTQMTSGCSAQTTAGISGNAFTVAASQVGTCSNDPMLLSVFTNTPIAPANYEVIQSSNNQSIETGAKAAPFTSGTPFNTTKPLQDGESYIVKIARQPDGCFAFSPPVTINEGPQVNVAFDLSQVCAQELGATSTNATIFDWSASPAGSILSGVPSTNPVTNTPKVKLSPGTWTITVTADDGPNGLCPATDFVPLTIDNNLTPTITQTGDACTDQVQLNAAPTGNFTYQWSRMPPGGTPASFAAGPTINAGVADNNASYVVNVISRAGCAYPSTALAAIVLGELTVDLTNPQPCEGATFAITGTTNQPPDTYTWTLNQKPISGANGSTYTITNAAKDDDGTYQLTVARSAGGKTCSASDAVQILVSPSTRGLLPDTGIICPHDGNNDPNTKEPTLNPGTDFISYRWSTGDTTATIQANAAGLYTVDLINVYGCPSSDQITLVEQCDPVITGPNAFRPDGLNKEFFLFTFFIADTDFEIFIFNRWGEMVFHSNKRDFKWNGGYNNNAGAPVPPGTYSYIVKYKSFDPKRKDIKEQRGGVVVLR